MVKKAKKEMKVNSLKIKEWIEPEYLVHYLASIFGESGMSWLDSDGGENGEFSYLGLNPKKIISTNKYDNENPFEKLRKIDKGFWIGWMSYEAGSWLEPKNKWQESDMATLWIASYDPIIKFNLIKKEISLESLNLNKLKDYKNIIEQINVSKIKENINLNLIFDFSKIDLDKISKNFKKKNKKN